MNTALTAAGPRNRAPLGNKTTNIKATSLLTPAIQTHEKPLSAKPTSPRLRRAKVKIHQAEADPLDDEGSEHEIEYMPPRGEPLPDYPDDWPHDRTYPQFEGKNLTRGCWLEFRPDKDPEELSDFDEKLKKIEERERKKAKTLTKAAEGHGTLQARKPVDSRPAPATLSSKYAAAALSSGPKPTVRSRGAPSFAAPTAATKARFPPALASKKPAATTAAPGNARHTAAKVSSNTTLGYSKGRVISGAARAPFTGAASKPVDGVAAKKDEMAKKDLAGGSTVLDELFSSGSLSEDSSEDDDAALSGNVAALDLDTEDDDLAAFQLPAVDLT